MAKKVVVLLDRHGVKALKCSGDCEKLIEKKQAMVVWFKDNRAHYWCLPCWEKRGRK